MARRAGDDDASQAVRPGTLTALLQEIAAAPEAARAWEGTLRAGVVVGRFELVRELGRGGFGVVWEARDRELGRSVAFKAVRAGAGVAAREGRLQEEAEAAARLQHPNILTLHDAGRAEQGPYLVLELLHGRTLAQRLAEGALPVAEAVRIALEVAKGLDHAHARGVVHRDLKPGNVFLCQDGQVKVLDFGLAHLFGRRRQDGGTPAYMAPEQMAGAPEDERTDVFALGAMLFEMLSGKVPFLDAAALASSSPAPRLETPEVPTLGELVGRMLAKAPVGRPRDGSVLLQALAGIRDQLDRPSHLPAPVRVRRRMGRPAVLGLVAGALAAAAAALLLSPSWRARHPGEPEADAGATPSIAVLPFADASPAHDQGYLADGIAEEILNALAQVDGLRVAGRTSSFYFKGKDVRLAEIGRELRVAHVLEGSVQKSGQRVRVTAGVVRIADGSRLWARSFDRELVDIFALQDEIAREVVEALRVRLAAEGWTTRGSAPGSPEAFTQVLLGRDLLRSGKIGDAKRGLEACERAVALDPNFALGWVGLAQAIYWIEAMSGEGTLETRRRRGLEAADRAVELAPGLPQGYVERARLRRTFLLDWRGAQADVQRARELGPGDAAAALQSGALLLALGRAAEASAEIERATEIDPLWAVPWMYLGQARFAAGDHERGRAALLHALEISPRADPARYFLAADWVAVGQPARALEVAERAELPWVRWTGTALAQHDLGRPRESQAALDQLVARNAADSAYQIAEIHAWRGEADRAFEWLERARVQRDTGMGYVKTDQLLRKVRGDRRFQDLLRRLDLPLD
ncbi:MAG TPA: protein kinase [Anaeromyxobacteraceae bacterium]|nr:protein kinase [Anaeromyxobacteraceae bacterium]